MLPSFSKKNRDLHNELNLLRNKYSTLEKENSLLKEQLQEKSPDIYSHYQAEVGVSIQKQEKLQEQVFLLKSELDYFKGLKPPQTLDAEINTDEAFENQEKGYLLSELDRLSNEKKKLMESLNDHILTINSLKSELQVGESTKETLNSEIVGLESEKNLLYKKLDGTCQELMEQKLQLLQKSREVDELQFKLLSLGSSLNEIA